MWWRAVWIKGGEGMEGLISSCWVDKDRDHLHWPADKEPTAMRPQTGSQKGWLYFDLVKIKIQSGMELLAAI